MRIGMGTVVGNESFFRVGVRSGVFGSLGLAEGKGEDV